MNKILKVKKKVGRVIACLITDNLTGFRREQKWNIIEEQEKPGRKRKLNIPSRRIVLEGDFLHKVGPEENTDCDCNHEAQKNVRLSNEDKKI